MIPGSSGWTLTDRLWLLELLQSEQFSRLKSHILAYQLPLVETSSPHALAYSSGVQNGVLLLFSILETLSDPKSTQEQKDAASAVSLPDLDDDKAWEAYKKQAQ